ncbi:MAG TPA: YggS family pyridoxal phosphate-dependent enzyme [Bacteroidales bacterium]|nr:YggS family pyridoxal phosphate-dependent enzyme [Bacteroidales bacterium]HBZ19842.1 YggS family pyridoxal phosphate-dependent enzyme [Bacteroidales bacterium]
MADIASNIISLKQQIPTSVKLVAVSKTKPVSDILEAYNAGQKSFGENRVQELMQKKDLLPGDIEWHLIGHLQSNKVKLIVPFIRLIHSVDTFKLLKTINFEATRLNRVVDCLLQIHIAEEETKFGFSIDEINKMTGSEDFLNLNFIRICGVMGMATYTEDTGRIQKEFRYLAGCFNKLRREYFAEKPWFKEVSMGMSGDFKIAIGEGSTIVRIGSLIFGERK